MIIEGAHCIPAFVRPLLQGLLEAEEASAFAAASTRRVAVRQGEAVGGALGQAPLAEEQEAHAAKVLKHQKQQLKKITEALGPDALEVRLYGTDSIIIFLGM